VVCSLPVVLLVLAWWRRGRIGRADLLAITPMLVAGLALGAVTIWMEKAHVGARGEAWALSLLERVLVAGRALWFYAGKLLWPHPLVFNYPRWQIDAGVWWQHLFPLAAFAVLAGLLLARQRLGRGPAAAVLFFAVTLAPALGFVDVYPMRYSFVADHFQYLASLGPITLGAAVAARQRRHLDPRLGRAAAAAVLGILGALTWRQAHAYRDAETLWRDTIAKNPASTMARVNLGVLLNQEGRIAEAIAQYRAVLALDPADAEVHNNLGIALAAQGSHGEAMAAYAEALRLDPSDAQAHNNLGNTLATQGRLEEAAAQYVEALALAPRYAEAHANLGNVLAMQQRPAEAAAHYAEAIRLDPEFADPHHNLGVVLAEQGRLDEAAARFREALRLAPGHAKARASLERVLAERQPAAGSLR
jgi:tetratricopeptide (TPR) repeat protein